MVTSGCQKMLFSVEETSFYVMFFQQVEGRLTCAKSTTPVPN